MRASNSGGNSGSAIHSIHRKSSPSSLRF
jgi:hypothetical protein